MPRFFVSPDAVSENTVTVRDREAYHIARSLRMAVGDTVTVSTGKGEDYLCRLTRIRDDECVCEILERLSAKGEPPVRITLYMAYPKGDKMETVTQKAVELGASAIIPFCSERCIKRPQPEKAQKQTERLSRIAEEAAKQCGRSTLAEVSHPLELDEMLERIKSHELTLFCYEGGGTKSLRRVLEDTAQVTDIGVIVGSEGGFSPKEAELIAAKGAVAVNLGPRILRCETAPDYVLSAISYRFEL